MKRTLIVGGGPVNPELLQNELNLKPDLVIAADRGGAHLYKQGVFPQVLLGDFDSLASPLVKEFSRTGVRVLQFSPQKDETDMELAVEYAIQNQSETIIILGGLGQRLDHTLSNIGLLLKVLAHNIEIHLLDEEHDITAINRQITLVRRTGWAVSLLPLTLKVVGVTTTGLKFPLNQASLFMEESRGLHNEFIAETATVELTEGNLLIIMFKEQN